MDVRGECGVGFRLSAGSLQKCDFSILWADSWLGRGLGLRL